MIKSMKERSDYPIWCLSSPQGTFRKTRIGQCCIIPHHVNIITDFRCKQYLHGPYYETKVLHGLNFQVLSSMKFNYKTVYVSSSPKPKSKITAFRPCVSVWKDGKLREAMAFTEDQKEK